MEFALSLVKCDKISEQNLRPKANKHIDNRAVFHAVCYIKKSFLCHLDSNEDWSFVGTGEINCLNMDDCHHLESRKY